MMMTIADVIQQLVEAHEQGKDINLNKSVHFYTSETQFELFSHCTKGKLRQLMFL